tara:strand:+ start:229 stop:429 length:201 start_codon:yes stop_codon:yes gene_type:complete
MNKKNDDNVILLFPQNPPPGPLCRGKYAALYKALDELLASTEHGANFVLPDFRGMFINGWKEEDNG